MKFIKEKKIVNDEARVDLFSTVFSSALFIGFIPAASGTFGSLFALLFFLVPSFENFNIIIPVIIIVFSLGIITSSKMVKRYGDDPSVVVIDEVLGMWITVLIVKFFFVQSGFVGIIPLIISFFAFRFFDIIKIFPVTYFDNIKNGFGIMMDDVMAGIYAGLAGGFIVFLINHFTAYKF